MACWGCHPSASVPTGASPTAPTPSPAVGVTGVYRLTFTAAASCQLPDDAKHRTYTATINQAGTTVTLTDAHFWTDGYCGVMNTFDGYVQGDTVSLSDWGGDCGIEEQLASTRYLKLWGTAKGLMTEPIPFNGSVSVVTPDGSNESKPIAACTAPDHQLVFEKMQ
jgi:hypothetical protein